MSPVPVMINSEGLVAKLPCPAGVTRDPAKNAIGFFSSSCRWDIQVEFGESAGPLAQFFFRLVISFRKAVHTLEALDG